MCYIAVVQRGDGGIREIEVEATDQADARRIIADTLPGVKLVRLIPTLWRSA